MRENQQTTFMVVKQKCERWQCFTERVTKQSLQSVRFRFRRFCCQCQEKLSPLLGGLEFTGLHYSQSIYSHVSHKFACKLYLFSLLSVVRCHHVSQSADSPTSLPNQIAKMMIVGAKIICSLSSGYVIHKSQ